MPRATYSTTSFRFHRYTGSPISVSICSRVWVREMEFQSIRPGRTTTALRPRPSRCRNRYLNGRTRVPFSAWASAPQSSLSPHFADCEGYAIKLFISLFKSRYTRSIAASLSLKSASVLSGLLTA